MATKFENFVSGVGLVPNSTDQNTTFGDISTVISSSTLNFHNGTSSSPILTISHAAQGTNKVLNKDFDSATTQIVDSTTTSKAFGVTLAGSTASTKTTFSFSQTANRTLSFPDATDTIVARNTTDTLTNKSLDGNNNTFTNIPNSALSSDVVLLNAVQTLTNKTLTTPVVNSGTFDNIIGISGSDLSIASANSKNILIVNNGGYTTIDNIKFSSNTITTSTGNLTVQGISNTNLILNAFGTGYTQFQRNATTYARVGTQVIDFLGQTSANFYDSTSTNYVGFKAPSSVTASYTVTMPTNAPSGNTALVYNGSSYVWSTAGGWNVGTSASLTDGGNVTISITAGQQLFIVAGASGPVTLSGTALGVSAPVDGSVIRLMGNSNTNTVSLVNTDSSKGVILNGNCTLYKYNVIEFQYSNSLDRFVETFRNF